MKLGFENKRQTVILGVLLAVLAWVFYSQVLAPSGDVPVQARTTPAASSRPDPVPGFGRQAPPDARPRPSSRIGARTGMQFKMNGREQNLDPAAIDPTLRLDLLAKVQSVTLEGGERNLFQFGAPPMPKTPEPKIIPNPAAAAPPPADTPPPEPVKPPPPPIPLRFYGYSQARPGEKRAFFLDGEEIIVATEGETIQRRYKIVRIGVNSVVVEDTQHNHQQTLPLQEPTG
jgi:hypothetical protein